MLPLLGLVTGPIGKIAGTAVLALGLVASAAAAIHEYNAHIRADLQTQIQAAEQVKTIARMTADHDRTVAALTADAAAAANRAAAMQPTRKAIANAPTQSTCMASPAVRAGIGGMRHHAATDH